MKSQMKTGESSDDKLDLILKRIEALEKGKGRGRGRGYQRNRNYYSGFENNNQNNTPAVDKDEEAKEVQKCETQAENPLNA